MGNMGNNSSSNRQSNTSRLFKSQKAYKRVSDVLSTVQILFLHRVYKDLEDRNSGQPGITKNQFGIFFPMNGLLNDQLFSCFEKNNDNLITFDEFIVGVLKFTRSDF